MRVFRGVVLSACMMLALAGTARAQAVGQILGTVTDSSGGVLPGVTVTVTGTGLQQPLVGLSTTTGAYTFPKVPIGTYTVTFELTGFKKFVRTDVLINTGFSAKVDAKMEIGGVEQKVEVTAASPLVDTKKTTTGGTFTGEVMVNVPTARDPWQVINMTPAVVLSGVNVGGSASGQQLGISAFGSSGSVQWNLEGGNITDMSSNSSPAYFNFDSFQEIQVITGGGDVSVQSAGLFINLVTKSGSNVVKGSATETFENASMQSQNVTQAQFNTTLNSVGAGSTGLSGNPLHRIGVYSAEIGGPIMKNRLWYWGGTDYQDINVGVSNYFDLTKNGCNPPPSTFAQLSTVQGCLNNDKTTIQDFNGKVNFQINSANKFQFLSQTDRKLRNNRGASNLTTHDATQSQYSVGGRFANPTYQGTHTLLLTDKLVFVNQLTYLKGGFFLDYHDYPTCGSSTYQRDLANQDPVDPTCMWNIQTLTNRTTGLTSRALNGSYQTARPSWEVKSDGNYFLSHVLGGDHALKFGGGWRKNPVLSFSHQNGGAIANVECLNNSTAAGCADGSPFVPVGSGQVGLVPFRGILVRDSLTNYDWHTWFGYLQDSYTTRRLTINGGLRDDWQTSKFLGGCVQANVIRPDLLPQQCQGAADPNQPFNNISPRVSATYDLSGKGTTAIHGSFSYYYASKITLANGLSNLNTVALTYGSNTSAGACTGTSCWNDANHDGIVQANELSGNPTANTSRFDPNTGILSNVAPTIDPNLKIGRTREGIIGLDHQLMANLHATFDFTYRYNDRGSQTYIVAASGTAADAIAQITQAAAQWQQLSFTDPNTGITAPFYQCVGCVLPSGATFSTTSLQYQTYKGVTLTVVKRLSNKWQGNVSYTWNDFRQFTPLGSFATSGSTPGDPQGVQFTNGFTNNTPRYTIKAFASAELPWGLLAGMNLNVQDGNVRTLSINGPGNVPVGNSQTSLTTITFQPAGSTRLPATKLLDLNVAKTLSFGKQKLTLTLDCFNVFNTNTVQGFSSNLASNNGNNGSPTTFLAINSIVPPRVFRVDARFTF